MNVFDEEMGPLVELSDEEFQRMFVLALAGLTMEELRAYETMRSREVN